MCCVLCVMCYVLCVMCYVLCVMCYVLCVMCYVLCVMCYVLNPLYTIYVTPSLYPLTIRTPTHCTYYRYVMIQALAQSLLGEGDEDETKAWEL
jgi:hypothetical protein